MIRMLFFESSLAILVILAFITVLLSYSIVSTQITSSDEFLLYEITKRQIFCFFVCFPPFYITILIATRITLFPGNVVTFLYELYNCSIPLSSSLSSSSSSLESLEFSQKCNNFDEVNIIINIISNISANIIFQFNYQNQYQYLYYYN